MWPLSLYSAVSMRTGIPLSVGYLSFYFILFYMLLFFSPIILAQIGWLLVGPCRTFSKEASYIFCQDYTSYTILSKDE